MNAHAGHRQAINKPKEKKQFEAKKKDIVPFNQRIASAAKDKNLSNALQQWEQITQLDMVPTAHTYCGMVNAFVRCGQLSRAEELVKKMEVSIPLTPASREGFVITLTALLKGYFMSSAYTRAHALFQKIMKVCAGRLGSRTLDTYLRGCLRTGAFQQGLTAFESHQTEKSDMSKLYAGKMYAIRLAVKSSADVAGTEDASVCIHIASACVRLGKLDRAREWFTRARECLFTAAPERQFDKMQKGEMVRICDFFTSADLASNISVPIESFIERFVVVSGDVEEQIQIWKSLGLGKFRSDEQIAEAAASAIATLAKQLSKAAEKSQAVVLEVCSGSGEWIAREASKAREKVFIATEFRFDRCVDILTRQMSQQLDNLWILCGDARRVPSLVPRACISELHVNYPEPPPVNSTHIEEAMSSDVVTKSFLREMRPLLIDNGELSIVSDDKLYIHTVANTVADALNMESVFPKSSKTLVDSYFARFFSKKAKRWAIHLTVPALPAAIDQ